MTWTKLAAYVESITLQEGLGAALKWLKDGSCFPVDHNLEDNLDINVSTMFDAQHDSPSHGSQDGSQDASANVPVWLCGRLGQLKREFSVHTHTS